MSRLLNSYRKNGLLIIHVIRLYLPDGSNVDACRRQIIEQGKAVAAPETEGAELVQELKRDDSIKLNSNELLSGNFQQIGNNEFVMYKPRWGTYYGTKLA